jgi:flagellin
MSMVIGTNISSLTAQRHLASSKGDMDSSMERLASGSRINSSSDDAAGLAIAGRMTSQINGLNQAVRNANDGVAMAQSAEGALDETTSILQRMRDLSVQASSDTLTASDRGSIQAEITALTDEIGRIAETTTFNNINLLDGSAKNLQIQVGAGEGEKLSMTITSATASDLGLNSGSADSGTLAGGRMSSMSTIAGNDVLINGVDWIQNGDADVGATVTVNDAAGTSSDQATTTAAGVAAIINSGSIAHGAVATASNLVEGTKASGVTTISATPTENLKINNVFISASASLEELVININNEATNAKARVVDGRLELFNDTGEDILIAGTAITGSGLTALTNIGFLSLSNTDGSKTLVSQGENDGRAVADVNALGFNARTSASSMKGSQIVTAAPATSTAGNLTSTDDLTINGVAIGPSSSNGAPSAGVLAAHLNTYSADTKVTASASTEGELSFVVSANGQITTGGKLTVNGTDYTFGATAAAVAADSATGNAGGHTVDFLADQLNKFLATGGSDIVATADGHNLVLGSVSGATISAAISVASVISGDVHEDGTVGVLGTAIGTRTFTGSLSLTNTDGGDISFGSNTGTEAELNNTLGKLGLHQQGSTTSNATAEALSMSTSASAAAAVTTIDAALEKIFANRGDLGALQNRLEHTVSNLRNVSENMSFSKSQIMDTDFATESANLAKAQVLQQAGTAMLAQANASGQSVLSLLK